MRQFSSLLFQTFLCYTFYHYLHDSMLYRALAEANQLTRWPSVVSMLGQRRKQ